ncbi:unnamed protein product, partial [Gongylonema pulchrum]|uniref:UNC80 domain-containing protein n=1 Tax=Gongylonema pulchrum TaxID=637853 RepID=A0A183F0F0_9BILA
MTAVAKLNRYFRRLIRFRQMDFEFALWQMIYLLIKPQKVYRNFMYRKRSFASNNFLRRVDDQDVEWGYCFDVHLNAFFPMLMLLHVLLPLTFS